MTEAQRQTEKSIPVIVHRVVAAGVGEVFAYLTNPERMMEWMTPYPGDVRCVAHAEARAGGTFRLSMTSPDNKVCEISGEYVSVDPRRLVFTWTGPPTHYANTLVTVELEEIDTDRTKLTLTHERLPASELREPHAAGWNTMLEHLDLCLPWPTAC